jgi:hypothetical protein
VQAGPIGSVFIDSDEHKSPSPGSGFAAEFTHKKECDVRENHGKKYVRCPAGPDCGWAGRMMSCPPGDAIAITSAGIPAGKVTGEPRS